MSIRRAVNFAILILTVGLTTSSLAFPPRQAGEDEAYRLLRDKKFAEAVDAFAKLVEANPYDGGLQGGYGQALHGAKRDDDAIRAMQAAADLGWGPSANFYNIACVMALRGQKDEAIEQLRKSLDAGFAEQQTLETDSDMDSLRSDPRFIEMMGLKVPPLESREAQRRYDLDFFARRMKQMHWNLYMKVPEANFLSEIERLKSDVPKLEDLQVLTRLTRIVASVGDGHTRLRLTSDDAPPPPRLPVRFYQFEGGLFVTSASPGDTDAESLLGAKVLRIGSLSIEDALKAARPYCSVDNSMGYVSDAPRFLELPWVLDDIGAVTNGNVEIAAKQRDGKEFTVRLQPIVKKRDEVDRTFVRANRTSNAPVPLYLKDRELILGREYLPQRKLVYFRFGAVADPPKSSLEEFCQQLFDFINKEDAQYLVIDMRHNTGGNTGLVPPLLEGIVRCDRVNRDGHLFVITGRETFSAAVNTVTMIEQQTRATFVGEPPGSPPSFVGESTYFYLPYHRNRVTCSSRYWQYGPSVDKRQWVSPQIAVRMKSTDFLDNHDPVMDAIFAAIDATPASTRP